MKTTRWLSKKTPVLVLPMLGFCLAVTSFAANTTPVSNPRQLAKTIELKVIKYAAAYQFSGNILVAKGNRILSNKSFGAADVENQVKNGPQTRFLIGAVTQQFTAALILRLQEKNLLKIEDTIDQYVPGFPACDQITIHQLLNHTSGLPGNISWSKVPANLSEAVEIAKSKPIKFAFSPGQGFGYSDMGYILLGYIIEKVSGQSYQEYIQENIFSRLKMTNSGLGYDSGQDTNLALSYEPGNTPAIKNRFFSTIIRTYATGGIYSTTEDLFKWNRALSTNALLNQNSLKKMFASNKNNCGYGWLISRENGKAVFTYNGSLLGFRSTIIRRADEDICIIALSNQSNFDEFETNMLDSSIMKCFLP